MRSRAARLTLGATAWLTLGAAAFFIVTTETSIAGRRAALGTFDTRARQLDGNLADVRAGQQAYVAAGQTSATWIPKVGALTSEAAATLDLLRATAVTGVARQALLEASAAITEFGNVDKRVRDYLIASDNLMASDVVFGEGVEAATEAARGIESARVGEHQAYESYEAHARTREAYALAGVGGLTALILVVLALSGTSATSGTGGTVEARAVDEVQQTQPAAIRIATPGPGERLQLADEGWSALKSAAEICTEFGRMHDQRDLQILLGHAARLLNASGLVVWLGDSAGADLRPVLAEGYSASVLALMRPVPRMADNAAASAYRSGSVQIVAARPGASLGAVVAPLLTAEGCIGALTAEIRDGQESSGRVEALASILAAQLAGALASSASADASVPHARTASA